MPARFARLGAAGRKMASLLYTLGGSMTPPTGDLEKYSRDMKDLGLDGEMLVAGIDECVHARVVLRADDSFVLVPDFMLLGDKWFPDWRTENLPVFHRLLGAFATLDRGGKLDPEMAKTLLGWAIAIGVWEEAGLLCIRLCQWLDRERRLEEEAMEGAIRVILPHVEGETKTILEGDLVCLLASSGRYADALTHHKAMEARFRALPKGGHDYYLNVIANLTQQIDCLIELDRLEEAAKLWDDAFGLAQAWPDRDPGVIPRLHAQRATIYREAGDEQSGLREIAEALDGAADCSDILVAQFRFVKADLLRRLGRFQEAELELRKVEPLADSEALRPEELRGPNWEEHVLESLEHDRERGDPAGVAISLVTLARIFIDQGELDRAKERLREALPYVKRSGLARLFGTFARLCGEIELAEGSKDSAKSWLTSAHRAYKQAGSPDAAEAIRRLMQTV
jgi:tetratricopeptide (TPR) repeat protein